MYFKTLDQVRLYLESHSLSEKEELMIFVADNSSCYLNELMDYLNNKNITFFGGIYPALLVGPKKRCEGFIIQRLEPIFTTLVLPFLMRCKLDLNSIQNSTALILVDGLSSKMKDLTDTVYNKLGNHINYIGGGAGFSDLNHRPCIFNNKGIYKDALIISIIKSEIKIAVKHGWNRLAGPFFVSKSEDNILSQLDYENAFEVYKHVIEEFEDLILSSQDFFTFAKDHPFGIVQNGHSDIVRDPIMLNEHNEIVCVASIPKDKDVYILKGDIKTLLASSIEVSEECSENNFEKYQPLLFNCISRSLFMGERFEEELSNIQIKMKHPVLGTLSIGEIASLNNGNIEIHNKSTVLGAINMA